MLQIVLHRSHSHLCCRFTFWSVALDRIFENKKSYEHPVLLELQKLHQHQVITDEARHYLTQLIEAREQLALTPYLSTCKIHDVIPQWKFSSQCAVSMITYLVARVLSSIFWCHMTSALFW